MLSSILSFLRNRGYMNAEYFSWAERLTDWLTPLRGVGGATPVPAVLAQAGWRLAEVAEAGIKRRYRR